MYNRISGAPEVPGASLRGASAPCACAGNDAYLLGLALARGCVVQFLIRYPVLKIHHTTTMQMARNISVMPTLTPTLTSAIS